MSANKVNLSKKNDITTDFFDFKSTFGSKPDYLSTFRPQKPATLQSSQQNCFHEAQESLIYRNPLKLDNCNVFFIDLNRLFSLQNRLLTPKKSPFKSTFGTPKIDSF